ncbi:hypothetical protein SLA2020_358630 [Shorea laevis]
MITRQLFSIPKQGWFKNFHTSQHVHQLFDRLPEPKLNTPISPVNQPLFSCLHANLPLNALQRFRALLILGNVSAIDEVTLALALKACCGDSNFGSQVHNFAVTSGLISFVTVSNSLMNMYSKSGEFDKALCMFESLSDPDIVSWNTVLSGFLDSEDALNFVARMNFSGVVFDVVTYSTALSFCVDDEGFLLGLQLHSLIMKFGLDCEIFVGNALITMYSRWKSLMEARKVFDEMPNRDLVSWNAMLSGYTQEGSYGLEAIKAFIEMVRMRMKLDHVSFTSAVSACGHERNLELGRQIHSVCIKGGYGTHISVCNVLISLYSKCELVEDAKLVFWRMNDRNVISWTTMISTDEQNVVSLFNAMRSEGVYSNDVTFIGLLHAITNRKLVKEGQMIHGLCVRTNFLSESNVCNSLITMYAKFESIEDSVKIFEELGSTEIISWNALISGYAQNGLCLESLRTFLSAVLECKPNQYTFGSVLSAIGSAEAISLKHGQRCHSHIIKVGLNTDPIVSNALLDMYAKRGSICESQRVFHETPERSTFAWTAIISAYARHGDYDSVMNWFEEMKSEGITPDAITFLSVLTACGRKGMVDMGRKLFDSMKKDYQIEPFSEHYSCMVDMFGRAGRLKEAEELMSGIPGGPGLSMLQSLLGACRIHGNVELGERVADALMELEPTESGSYVLMSNLYAEKGNWEKVATVRKGMRERGVKKEVGFSWVDVGDTNSSLSLHAFSSGDTSHPQSDDICLMAECLAMEMKFLKDRNRHRESTLAI